MKIRMLKPTFDPAMGYLRVGRELQTGRELDQASAERWINRKIAIEVIDNGGQAEQTDPERHEAESEPQASVDIPESTAETQKGEALNYDDYVKASRKTKPVDLADMTKQELINEAVKQGVQVQSNMTKADIIERLIGG